jgi:hypothetical protein
MADSPFGVKGGVEGHFQHLNIVSMASLPRLCYKQSPIT